MLQKWIFRILCLNLLQYNPKPPQFDVPTSVENDENNNREELTCLAEPPNHYNDRTINLFATNLVCFRNKGYLPSVWVVFKYSPITSSPYCFIWGVYVSNLRQNLKYCSNTLQNISSVCLPSTSLSPQMLHYNYMAAWLHVFSDNRKKITLQKDFLLRDFAIP